MVIICCAVWMTEYWKSYAKKYCDVCKCWLTDNKASVQFHESGKRHKENVEKKINELVKKATKEDKQKKELDEDMRKMEEAAMKAYMKDVQENPDHSGMLAVGNDQVKAETAVPNASHRHHISPKDTTNSSSNMPEGCVPLTEDNIWYEAFTDEGLSYFWNSETNKTFWEPPEEIKAIVEQNKEKKSEDCRKDSQKLAQDAERDKQQNDEKEAALQREKNKERIGVKFKVKSSKDKSEEKEDVLSPAGPPARTNPYGAWTTVVTQPKKIVDLQLPPSYQPAIQQAAYTAVEPKVIKIKEKTISSTDIDSLAGPANFKKRKFTNKGNTRQRFDDDD